MMDKFAEQVKLAVILPEIAQTIDAMVTAAGLPKQPWSLYTWGGNRCQYISNTSREQSRIAMKETLDRWDESQDPPPNRFES
jgi:hypothetical protein